MLFQVASYGFPNWGAESYQTARMAEAFAECGAAATLVHTGTPGDVPWSQACDVYGLRRLPDRSPLLDAGAVSARWFRGIRMTVLQGALTAFALRTASSDTVFARAPGQDPLRLLLWLKRLGALKANVVVELHETHHYVPAVDGYVTGYVVIHERLKAFLESTGVSGDRIAVAPNAADLEAYETAHQWNRPDLRIELGLDADERIVCYTGRLSPSRNIETLIAAMDDMRRATVLLLVGDCSPAYEERLTSLAAAVKRPGRVRIMGRRSARDTMKLQMAADVLALPYGARLAATPKYSPLKLGEYLGSGRPIVAFPIPVLCDVLSDDDVVWAREETSAALADAIEAACQRPPRSIEDVRRRLAGWTWQDRARMLTDFFFRLESETSVSAAQERPC